MAHTCPECGQMCHCGGDIDDIDFGENCEEADACTHWKQCSPEVDPSELESYWEPEP